MVRPLVASIALVKAFPKAQHEADGDFDGNRRECRSALEILPASSEADSKAWSTAAADSVAFCAWAGEAPSGPALRSPQPPVC